MNHPSEFRSAVKYSIYQILGPEIADRLRNLYSHKDKAFYDRNLARKVKSLVQQRRQHRIVTDVELLCELHRLFPTFNLGRNYQLANLLKSARSRFRYLASSNIDLEGKDLVDFGAGHGENLMLLNELNLNSCTGYDFSDSNFLMHKDEISADVFNSINYQTLDLVNDDIGTENADIIVSFSAFEHFEDPGVVLEKCHRALRPGGILYTEFAAFNAPFATHRKIFTGIPYIQNIFADEVSYEFYYEILKINEGVNRYTNERIVDGNPYPEVNRWKIPDYEKIFLDPGIWEVLNYTKVYNYQYKWFVDIFKKEFQHLSKDDIYVDYFKILIRKK